MEEQLFTLLISPPLIFLNQRLVQQELQRTTVSSSREVCLLSTDGNKV